MALSLRDHFAVGETIGIPYRAEFRATDIRSGGVLSG